MLLDHAATIALAGDQTGYDQDIQHGLPGLQMVFGHLFGDVALLEDAYELLLGLGGGGIGMVDRDDFAGELHLDIARVQAAICQPGFQLLDLRRSPARHQAEEFPHGFIGHAHHLSVHVLGGGEQRDMVAQRLAHLHLAIGAGQDIQDDADIGLLTQEGHQLAGGGDDIEELVGAADLDIGAQRVGIEALHEGVKGLVQVNWRRHAPSAA